MFHDEAPSKFMVFFGRFIVTGELEKIISNVSKIMEAIVIVYCMLFPSVLLIFLTCNVHYL